jgi:hypothetical protein
MALLKDDPEAREAVLEALTAVGTARIGHACAGPADDTEISDAADPARMRRTLYALAEIAGIALDALDEAGGCSAALTARIYSAVTG